MFTGERGEIYTAAQLDGAKHTVDMTGHGWQSCVDRIKS